MKSVSLSGSPRENVGKKDAAELRRQGRIPCVIYGGEGQTHFSLNYIEFSKLVYTPDAYKFQIEVDGKTTEAVVQEIQWHPLTDAILHVDFLELTAGKVVKIKLPVNITGSSIGVRNGGKLRVAFRSITLKGLPKDFPDAVDVDITEMKIGDSFRVRDIKFPGLVALEPAGAVIVGVKTARGVVLSEEEEAAAEAEAAEAEGGDAPAEGDEG